ncbi:hypothetical protein DB88DRAFT_276802 [Papiliotrema laurentii]|uniref:Uncharacterized protein n=1 Tax=Papiliotrema laurentii TaxID=5418 RepID=A0AAD9FM24_PAPLA|nr:hypothetical protein DB88DRAFT_276802 [Papiliotrema laurentii]
MGVGVGSARFSIATCIAFLVARAVELLLLGSEGLIRVPRARAFARGLGFVSVCAAVEVQSLGSAVNHLSTPESACRRYSWLQLRRCSNDRTRASRRRLKATV